ncbi:MAG: C4-dicarboxylate transporter DcuC [Planctomycetia bacterium]|nr:C4-dicarboxylate transporter DcuC [Planctomycetia bacterium]
MGFPGILALLVVIAAIVLVVKGWDVRLVLLSAALVIATPTGSVPVVVREFLATFSNEKFVVPICSAMGFAYVLRHTGCERHLVLLLVKPLRHVRTLMVPGVVMVGFLVNIPLVSQTSTAVCLGAVVVPLMRAAGYSMATIGACLLLGASVGGELLNPGAPELATVANKTGVSAVEQTRRYLPPLVFTQLAVSMIVIWLMSIWWERSGKKEEPNPPTPFPKEEGGERHRSTEGKTANSLAPPSLLGKGVGGLDDDPERINLLKALVPLVPIALLFASGLPKPYQLFEVPDEWVIAKKPDGTRNEDSYNTRLIGLAMLIGVLVAAAVTPGKARDCIKHFFEGAGYGFANVVSLIVTATCFGAAIKSAGLATALGELIKQAPGLMQPLAAFVPLAFAAVSGSGMASTQSLYEFFYDPAVALGLDPVSVGALVSLGSAAGRTMSPVAAVVLMCATLTGTNPFTLAKRVAGPLLVGMIVVVILRLCGVL